MGPRAGGRFQRVSPSRARIAKPAPCGCGLPIEVSPFPSTDGPPGTSGVGRQRLCSSGPALHPMVEPWLVLPRGPAFAPELDTPSQCTLRVYGRWPPAGFHSPAGSGGPRLPWLLSPASPRRIGRLHRVIRCHRRRPAHAGAASRGLQCPGGTARCAGEGTGFQFRPALALLCGYERQILRRPLHACALSIRFASNWHECHDRLRQTFSAEPSAGDGTRSTRACGMRPAKRREDSPPLPSTSSTSHSRE